MTKYISMYYLEVSSQSVINLARLGLVKLWLPKNTHLICERNVWYNNVKMSQAAIERGVPSVFDRLDQGSAARARNLESGRKTHSRLQSTTPEIPRSDISAFINSERGSTRLILPVTLSTLAAVAGAGYLLLSADRGPSAAPRDNAPISDTSNPPQSPDNSSVSPSGTGPDGSPDPKTKPPEAKIAPIDCGILSPETCAKGRYIQWNRPDGKPLTGMGFVLKSEDKIDIPEDLQVAATKFKQPHTYNGYVINGFRKDGSKLTFFTTATPRTDTMEVGQKLSAGTTVGVMGETSETVFKNAPQNFIILYSTPEELDQSFPNHAGDPEIINNTPVSPSESAKNVAPPIFDTPLR